MRAAATVLPVVAMRRGLRSLGVAAVVLLAACELVVTCPTDIAPGIELDVRSAATGRPAWFGVRGEARDGEFHDSLFVPGGETADTLSPIPIPLAWGRAGTYEMRVERPGYAPWDTAGVVVARAGGACPGVRTTGVVARLQPVP